MVEIHELFRVPAESEWLQQALTHPSYSNEVPEAADNQRMEFLGDAVLQLCSSDLLWQRFPDADEGRLTRMRAQLVNAEALARWARDRGVARALRVGRGAEVSGLREKTNVLADAVEALIAAAYLEGGLENARKVCVAMLEPQLDRAHSSGRDPKSELQERVQALAGPAPTYHLVERGGPDHAPWFEVEVRLGEQDVGRARGGSKRDAERSAARDTLESERWRHTLQPAEGDVADET